MPFQKQAPGGGRKILASVATFAFIYVWHGYFLDILIWSFLNGVGILLEILYSTFKRSKYHETWITGRFSHNNVLRIDAFIGTQLLILAVIANFFFLANYDVGILFLRKTYAMGLTNYLLLSTYLVFTYFSGEYWERRLKKK